jgi:cathepsin C
MREASLVAAVLAACVATVVADLPVHCLRHEVAGTWNFVISKPGPLRSGCGHNRPDTEDKQPARTIVDEAKDNEKMTVVLSNPNVAKTKGQTGTWTMVYDEGFEVKIDRRVFFAFSNFTYEQGKDSLEKKNVSHCGETMVGWYENQDRSEFGCYYGERLADQKTAPKAPVAKAAPKPASSLADDKPLDHKTQVKKVAQLNKKLAMLQLGWKARVMPQWNGRTMREINRYAGIKRTTRTLHREMLAQRSRPKASFLQRPPPKARAGKVPDKWDWSDVNGQNFLEPVMDQGDCGSCYDASTMRMLTSRHKITQNDTEALPWSINFPLFCGEYNQGCKGGYGFLTSKWSSDVGLLPATCMRYNTGGSCKLECDLEKDLAGQKRYRADNHRYINSFYGNFNSSVESIKEEIYRNGPVVLSFEPAEDFMFYSGGIYKSAPADAAKGKGTLKVLRKHIDYDQEWERVDHAVVCVGYGEEDGQKYWLIQNSWGEDWGEEGFFRMALGEDESGIEGQPEAADVVEDEQGGKQVSALFAENAARATQL